MADENLHNSEFDSGNYPEPTVSADAAWADMKKMLRTAGPKSIRAKTGKPFYIKSLLYAGAGLMVIAMFTYYLTAGVKQKHPAAAVYCSQDKPQQYTLPDGTLVFLNRFSSVIASSNPNEENTFIVKGAAYIEKYRQSHPQYRVKVGSLDVLPTNAALYASFDTALNISSVHIQSGTVLIETKQEKVVLAAGESVEYNENTKQLESRHPVDVNLYSYATNIFEFTNTPLKTAAEIIEKAYGVTIIFENTKLYNCRITTRFDNKSLKEVLGVMAYTLNFDYHLDEKKYQAILSGNGCE